MSFYPSEINASAQQQWKEVKVQPLWTLGLIKSRIWQVPAENVEILPGYRETEITAGGINWKGMQKIQGIFGSWGYKGGKFWGQRPSGVFGSQPHFCFYFAFSHLKPEIYWKALPSTEKELFCFGSVFTSHSRRAKMVPGQLQPQLLLDQSLNQSLTEESRNSGLLSPRPLTKLIKTWTQKLTGEMHWPWSLLLP